jgi:hypothetical protein
VRGVQDIVGGREGAGGGGQGCSAGKRGRGSASGRRAPPTAAATRGTVPSGRGQLTRRRWGGRSRRAAEQAVSGPDAPGGPLRRAPGGGWRRTAWGPSAGGGGAAEAGRGAGVWRSATRRRPHARGLLSSPDIREPGGGAGRAGPGRRAHRERGASARREGWRQPGAVVARRAGSAPPAETQRPPHSTPHAPAHHTRKQG